jgi:hypothetical protein
MVKGITSRHILTKKSTYIRGINMGTKKDKKKKKFWPILLIAAFVISLVACIDDFGEEDYSDTDSEIHQAMAVSRRLNHPNLQSEV